MVSGKSPEESYRLIFILSIFTAAFNILHYQTRKIMLNGGLKRMEFSLLIHFIDSLMLEVFST